MADLHDSLSPITGSFCNHRNLVPFVAHSIHTRLPQILDQIIELNDFDDHVKTAIQAIRGRLERDDIAWDTMEGELAKDNGPAWSAALFKEHHLPGKSPLEQPWFYLENLVYRQVLHAMGFWDPASPNHQVDPFKSQKTQSIRQCLDNDPASVLSSYTGNTVKERFHAHVLACLWGNRHDLSVSAGKVDHGHVSGQSTSDQDLLFVDQTELCWAHLAQQQGPLTFLVILDNCGPELFQDLRLADFLLSSFEGSHVVFHGKSHPVFVSDAIPTDVDHHIQVLGAPSKFATSAVSDEQEQVGKGVCSRLRQAIDEGRFKTTAHEFYTSPSSFTAMPKELIAEYQASTLCFTKGDANYRRLLGDLAWPIDSPFQDAVKYWPSALLTIRTCKSPVLVGAKDTQDSHGKIERMKQRKPDKWLVDGSCGVVHFKR